MIYKYKVEFSSEKEEESGTRLFKKSEKVKHNFESLNHSAACLDI